MKRPTKGDRLAILIPGLGAVATTLMAGVMAARRGLARPVGSLTQMGQLKLARATMPVHRALDLVDLDDLVFGGWDITDHNGLESALEAGAVDDADLEPVAEELSAVEPMAAVFDPNFVPTLQGPHQKVGATKWELAHQLVKDIDAFMTRHQCQRGVGLWCGSTEVQVALDDVHLSLQAFEEGLRQNHPAISPTMIYAWAHLRAGLPFINGAPNRALDCPALIELAHRQHLPIAGKDFKTGQTLLKTIIAPGLKARHLGLAGWYSTNILGNRDGAVLDHPQAFRTKEESKLSVLDACLDAPQHPELYGDYDHRVTIDYYPPRGDNKEGWDNIDLYGWMDYPMQLKINFLCRDSILAAPVALDLVLLTDLVHRMGEEGIQDWLGFYFKAPQTPAGQAPVHDLFQQQRQLLEQLCLYAEGQRRLQTASAE